MKNIILQGDVSEVLKTIPDNYVNCVVTSPPYFGLRDYGVDGQIGLEKTPEEYIKKMVAVFQEVKRVLRDDGVCWLNLGDSYNGGGTGGHIDHKASVKEKAPSCNKVTGLKPKDLIGIPWMVAFALRDDGWYLRQDIIWHKTNPMPESVKDRCTKAHEYVFLLSKSPKYYYDHEAIKEPGSGCKPAGNKKAFNQGRKNGGYSLNPEKSVPEKRNKRSVWTVSTKPYREAHFATFPPDLIKPMILAGCPEDGIVLDPFFGAGTTGLVAKKLNRNYIGIELNPEYCEIAKKRIALEVQQ